MEVQEDAEGVQPRENVAMDTECHKEEVPNEQNDIVPENGALKPPKDKTIEKFSDKLAEDVVKEAMLINEFYEKGKMTGEQEERDALADVLANGQEARGGYDKYIIDKFLQSEPDPEDRMGYEDIITGSNEDMEGHRYPGLDTGDSYVKNELTNARKGDQLSDSNNNRVLDDVLNAQADTGLATIHEGVELEIEKDPDKPEPDDLETSSDIQGATELEDNGAVEDAENDVPIQTEVNGHVTAGNEVDSILDTDRLGKDEENGNDGDVEDAAESDHGSKMDMAHLILTGQDESEDEDKEEEELTEECCEMTLKQKKRMVRAVRRGDIDRLEDLLEQKNATLDMTWYGETLLTAAVRAGQEEMALFLIDNGVDWKYKTKLLDRTTNGVMKMYYVTLRQLAYEHGLTGIVELLDYKTNNIFPFVQPPEQRTLRLRRPHLPFEPQSLMEAELQVDENEEETASEGFPSHEMNGATNKIGSIRKDSETKSSKLKEGSNGLRQVSDVVKESGLPRRRTSSTSSHNASSDDLSQVFGPDVGYETMSPISQYLHSSKHESGSAGMRDYTNIRGTRAFHLLKSHNSNSFKSKTSDSNSDYPMQIISTVGSYNFEKKRWQKSKSAPPYNNYSVESLPDAFVRVGLPFVHGSEKTKSRSSNAYKNSRRTQSAKDMSNSSPYSQVTRLLSESSLLNSKSRSSSVSSSRSSVNGKLPNIHRESAQSRITHIYTNRGSPDPLLDRLAASHRFPSHLLKTNVGIEVKSRRNKRN